MTDRGAGPADWPLKIAVCVGAVVLRGRRGDYRLIPPAADNPCHPRQACL